MIGPFGLSHRGTMRVRALPLARSLVMRGHKVKMVMPPWHGPEPARVWEEDGVELEYVSLAPKIRIISALLVTVRLVRCALAWRPDVIHCFKPKAFSGLAAWMLWQLQRLGLTKVRLFVDEDDWEGPGGWNARADYASIERYLFAWQERWGLRHNDGITVASRTLQGLAWSLGIALEKVHYLPNGAVVRRRGDGATVRSEYGLGVAPVVLLYTRFLEFDVARLVDVFARVVAEVPDARFLVVGAGLFSQDDERFDRLVSERGLSTHAVRAGWVPEEGLAGYFAASDVALYPLDDTLLNRAKCPVKLVDLVAAGVPVVADAVGQAVEYVLHGETGVLVSDGDPEAMSEGSISLLRDKALRQELSASAKSHFRQHFDWCVLAGSLLSVYQASV